MLPEVERAAEVSIRIRVPRPTRDLIDEAAAIVAETRTEFVLESARRRAVALLAGQRLFQLDGPASEAFEGILDRPPAPVEALRALMKRRPLWE